MVYMRRYDIIGPDNSLSSVWRQAIVWINAGLLKSKRKGTYTNQILLEDQKLSLRNAF